MAGPNMTLTQLNERHDEVWKQRNALMEEGLKDPFICQTAYRMIACELVSKSLDRQRSFLQVLADAQTERDQLKARFLTEMSRKGGQAKKLDSLQTLIEDIDQRRPSITKRELHSFLEHNRLGSIIEDIDEETISFTNHDGRSKQAKIAGLKDRLSRAKKKNRSR
jgi:hypothetical protein